MVASVALSGLLVYNKVLRVDFLFAVVCEAVVVCLSAYDSVVTAVCIMY